MFYISIISLKKKITNYNFQCAYKITNIIHVKQK
jgi:hypothetical protein